MNCPACGHHLTNQKAGKVVVDVCLGGCGGIWFDAYELSRVNDPHEIEGERLAEIEPAPGVEVDHTRRCTCPRCEGQVMIRRWFSPRKSVQIDECPSCGGYWLDAGELVKIREEAKTGGAQTTKVHISRLVYQYVSQTQRAG